MSKTKDSGVSPRGTAKYCWIDKPSTKFNADGEYSVSLVVSAEAVADFQKRLSTLAETAKAEKIKEDPKNAAKIKACTLALPFEVECDDAGNETGNVIIKFKQAAKITKKNGETFEKRINIFDAKGKPLGNVKVGRGSELKVAYTLNPYVSTGLKKYGVSLWFDAVQVLKLVEFSGGGEAKDFGFGEEEGYVGEDTGGEPFGASDDSPEDGVGGTATPPDGDF